MARFCEYCGAELQDGSMICPQCGAIPADDASAQPEMPQSVQFPETITDVNEDTQQTPEFTPAEPEAEKPRKKKKAKWLIPVAALVAVAVAVAFLWQPVLKAISPRTYVSMMMNNTNSAVEKRMEGTPVDVLRDAADCLENGSVTVDFGYDDETIGEIKAGLTLNSDSEAKKWKLDADLSALETKVDISAYMDGDVFAIGSGLIGGNYYGLTYSTFEKDLRSSAFGDMLDDDTIDILTTVVDAVDKSIDFSADLDKRLEPYAKVFEDYFKELEAENGSEKMEINGKQYSCSTVSFDMDEEGLLDVLTEIVEMLEDEDEIRELEANLEKYSEESIFDILAQISGGIAQLEDKLEIDATLTYYVYHSKVVNIKLDFEIEVADEDGTLDGELNICYGIDPKKDDTVIEGTFKMDDEKMTLKIVSGDGWEGDDYTSKTTITAKLGGEEFADLTQKIQWNKESGKLKLTYDVDGETVQIPLVLKATEDGCEISISDLGEFFATAAPDLIDEDIQLGGSLKITFRKGASITTPKFTNLDKIDGDAMEKIGTDLQESLGGLFGGFGDPDDDDDFDFDYDYDYDDDDDFDYDYDDDFDFDFDYDFGDDDAYVDSDRISCTGMAMDEFEVTLTANDPFWYAIVELEPYNTTDELVFESSDTSVATVDSEGLVTAVGNGTAVIYITCGEQFLTCDVTCDLGTESI